MEISPYNLQAVDPNNGLIELPENLTDAADRISAGCVSDQEARFVTSGRGGLPVNPRQKLQNEIVLQDLRNTVNTQQSTGTMSMTVPRQGTVEGDELVDNEKAIVEATGWIVNRDGDIEFVADNNQVDDKNNDVRDSVVEHNCGRVRIAE
ncbi:MAG: hypothetical protein AAFW70_06120 [Cyanobacteria bacterium J06635_10]